MQATRKLRTPRVMIVGCGDVGMRCVPLLAKRARVFALTSDASRVKTLRDAGVSPIVGNLDDRHSLARLAHLAPTVLHLAPPPKHGAVDTRTRALIATLSMPFPRRLRDPQRPLARQRRLRAGSALTNAFAQQRETAIVPDGFARTAFGRLPVRVVYASTTGVYGDCGGARFDETRTVAPANARAARRVSAERQLRRAATRGVMRVGIARIPGIYAAGRLPLARLAKGTPALADEDDVYTNHIHADDLAAILVRMIERAMPSRVIHASDDTVLKMGDYFDAVADAFGLARAPRISRADARKQIEPMLLSFMNESRRLTNERLKRELRITLRYPRVDDFLREAKRGGAA